MLNNRLKLNQAKTEFFVASSSHHYSSLQHLTLNFDGHEIPSSPSIRNLGVIFDYSMAMAEHITNLSRSINWQLRNLNRIREFLDTDTCHNIVRTLILSKLDYYNSLLYGIDKKHLNRLQVLQNKCARLILKQPSRTHASPLLQSLHWLPVEKRILFKLIVQAFKAFHFSSPGYLSSYFQSRVQKKTNTVSVRIWPLHLRSLVPKNKRVIVSFLWLGLIFGMGCRAVSVLSIIWTGSKTNLNLIFFLDSSKRLEHIVKGAI